VDKSATGSVNLFFEGRRASEATRVIRVLIVDDYAVVRSGLRRRLDSESDTP
jgi:hypothetical protein